MTMSQFSLSSHRSLVVLRRWFWMISALIALPLAAAAPLAQDHTVVFHNLDPEYYVEGPGLTKLDNSSLLAVIPVVPREP